MIYKEALKEEMERLAKNPKVRFVGYNLRFGSKFYGTLKDISEEQIIETPVAENLMCGIAMGLALEGFFPVLCFERMDFTLACADALVNHIGGLQKHGLVLPMIIRVCIGCTEPLDPGIQHCQDYTSLFSKSIATFSIFSSKGVKFYYNPSIKIEAPIMLIEYKELYEKDFPTY